MKTTDFLLNFFLALKLFEYYYFTETYISPIDPYRLFIDGDKYCLTFLFIICCQTCQRAWLNHTLRREFFSRSGFISQFPSLSNHLGLFHVRFPEPQELRACQCLSSAGKPRKTYIGKLLQSGEDTSKNQTHRHSQPIAPLLRCSLLRPKCFSLLEIPNSAWKQPVTFPSFCKVVPSPCMTMHHKCPCSGQQQVQDCLLNPWFVSQHICLQSTSSKQGSQLHCCVTWREDSPNKGPQSFSPSFSTSTAQHCTELDSCLIPAGC